MRRDATPMSDVWEDIPNGSGRFVEWLSLPEVVVYRDWPKSALGLGDLSPEF